MSDRDELQALRDHYGEFAVDFDYRAVMPREDTVTNTVEDAARFERERAEAAGEYDDRPTIRDI